MKREEKKRKPLESCQGVVNLSWIKERRQTDFLPLKNNDYQVLGNYMKLFQIL